MAKADWLTISPTSGTGNATITNLAAEHTGRSSRSCTVDIKTTDENATASYTVTQSGKTEYVSFDTSSTTVDATGDTISITGMSNSSALTFAWSDSTSDVTIPTTYTANSASATNGSAISGDPGASAEYTFAIELTIPENTGTEAVTRILQVSANGGTSATYTITQSGSAASLSVSPESVSLSADGGSDTVTVSSNTDWTAE